MSTLIEKIPWWAGGGLIRGSERAYSTYLNLVRSDVFDAMHEAIGGDLTLAEAKSLARGVNIMTGRPSLGQTLDQAIPLLSQPFLAPRWVASRFMQVLDPATGFSISGGTARVRKEMAKRTARFIIASGIIYALANVLKGEWPEWNPLSSRFLKVPLGNKRYADLSAGLAANMVFLSRMATQQRKTGAGKIINLRETNENHIGFGKQDTRGLLGDFLMTKLAPLPQGILEERSGRDMFGRPISKVHALQNMLVPLTFSDLKTALQADGIPDQTADALLVMFGASITDYNQIERDKAQLKAELARKKLLHPAKQ